MTTTPRFSKIKGVAAAIAIVAASLLSTGLLGQDLAKKLQFSKGDMEMEASKVTAEHADVSSLARAFVIQRLDLQAAQLNSALATHAASFHSEAWAQRDSVWPVRTIAVSWENASPANANERDWIRAAVERTWQKECAVRFVGWGPATASSK